MLLQGKTFQTCESLYFKNLSYVTLRLKFSSLFFKHLSLLAFLVVYWLYMCTFMLVDNQTCVKKHNKNASLGAPCSSVGTARAPCSEALQWTRVRLPAWVPLVRVSPPQSSSSPLSCHIYKLTCQWSHKRPNIYIYIKILYISTYPRRTTSTLCLCLQTWLEHMLYKVGSFEHSVTFRHKQGH